MNKAGRMNKADSRNDQPDRKQWAVFFGALVLIGVTIVMGMVA